MVSAALPALGDPIIGVDVTADGRFVIATCKTYLLLIDTLIGDGRYKGNVSHKQKMNRKTSKALTDGSFNCLWPSAWL